MQLAIISLTIIAFLTFAGYAMESKEDTYTIAEVQEMIDKATSYGACPAIVYIDKPILEQDNMCLTAGKDVTLVFNRIAFNKPVGVSLGDSDVIHFDLSEYTIEKLKELIKESE